MANNIKLKVIFPKRQKSHYIQIEIICELDLKTFILELDLIIQTFDLKNRILYNYYYFENLVNIFNLNNLIRPKYYGSRGGLLNGLEKHTISLLPNPQQVIKSLFLTSYNNKLKNCVIYWDEFNNGERKKNRLEFGGNTFNETNKNILNLIAGLLRRKTTFWVSQIWRPSEPTYFSQYDRTIHYLWYGAPNYFYRNSEELTKIIFVKNVQKLILKMNLMEKMYMFYFQKLKMKKSYLKFRNQIFKEIFSELMKVFYQKIDDHLTEKMRGTCMYTKMRFLFSFKIN